MTKINLNLVLILAIAIVVSVPIVYALVEPSIIINMDAGQTTKPFLINNENGTEVFSVDTTGIIFPSVGGAGSSFSAGDTGLGLVLLSFQQTAEISQTITATGEDNFEQLAKWRIDFNGVQNDASPDSSLAGVFLLNTYLNGFIKSSAGSCGTACQNDIEVIQMQTFDDLTFNDSALFVISNSIPFESVRVFGFNDSLCFGRNSTQSCFISVAWGSITNANGTASIKNLRSDILILLPEGASVTQVLP